MRRRSYLKLLFAGAAASFSAHAAGVAHAQGGAPQRTNAPVAPPAPTNLAQALRATDPDQIAQFTLRNSDVAAAAPINDRAMLLRNLTARDGPCAAPIRAQYESAALTLLRNSAANASELRTMVEAAGGAARVQIMLRGIQNADLAAVMRTALGQGA